MNKGEKTKGRIPSVAALKQTTSAVPTQWEGTLDDDRTLYVHYRYGKLSVGVGEGIDEAVRNSVSTTALYFKQIGDNFDGAMSFEELKGRLRGVLKFPVEFVVEGQHEWDSEGG